tara:strand:- start:1363 stop:1788 length:426 start_codon:yes stop_codon:yes gene_type:complete
MNSKLVDDKIKELFLSYRTIAIIGVSPDPKKNSNIIMKYLRNTGYKVFPVNPVTDNKIIHGEKVYKKLSDIHDHIGIVNVFRPSEETEDIAKQTVDIGANVLWLQLEIHNENAAKIVSENKIYYISNKCIKTEYERLFKTI